MRQVGGNRESIASEREDADQLQAECGGLSESFPLGQKRQANQQWEAEDTGEQDIEENCRSGRPFVVNQYDSCTGRNNGIDNHNRKTLKCGASLLDCLTD